MSPAPVSFSGFRFDPATGELTSPAGTTRLGPQPARLLAMLIARRGVLVTRAELRDALWGDAAVEADMGINTCVRQIRAALGDEADEGRFIQTLPRRGYRFVAALAAPTPHHSAEVVQPRPPQRVPLWMGLASASAIVVTAWMVVTAARGHDNRNVALLPLTPRPGDPAWVADIDARLTDQLVVALTSTGEPDSIGVVGPATTSPLASDPRPHTELGRLLDVGYVMSGGVRVSDSTVFLQLIRVTDGEHIFATRRPVFGVRLDTVASSAATRAIAKILGR